MRFLFLLIGALGGGACFWQRPARCAAGDPGPIRISHDSIGPLALWSNVSSIKATCPIHKHRMGKSKTDEGFPQIVINFRELEVIGIQVGGSLNEDASVDWWRVYGRNGVLPGGIPLGATWRQLRFLGPGRWTPGVDRGTVFFCNMPGVTLDIQAGTKRPKVNVDSGDLSGIPDDWVLNSVILLRMPTGAPWSC